MLKMYNSAVTFSEFPDEIAICVNISGCKQKCVGCSSPWLQEDVGEELTDEKILELIKGHMDCTVFGIMGGDHDLDDVIRIAEFVHKHSRMKVGFYSGRDTLEMALLPHIDLYKVGRWVLPEGSPEGWWKKNWGPIQFPFSNQLYFEKVHNKFINSSQKFRERPISDLERYIVKNPGE